MTGKDAGKTEKISELAEAISNERNCDILIFNFGLDAGFEYVVYEFLDKRTDKKKNLVLILTTEGGNSDTAFRIARRLQDTYDDLTIIVAGWCKSAGTLFCIAASNLIIAD